MKQFILSLFLCAGIFSAFSQEALKSVEEEYYDFLSLQGITERPTINYRTLSDSEWKFTSEDEEEIQHPWQNNNLGTKRILWSGSEQNQNWFTKGLNENINLKIYGPEWFNSYNTYSPYGQNDGALWQGKGYNTSLTAGARLEAFGFEVTLKPMVCFSENREFEIIAPNYSATENNGLYNDKASKYGYYGVRFVDAPQRFGDSSFWTFDWGDTEIRYTWHTLTVGFGTQSPWIGPAKINPIIHSNNAATYPKLDIGLRKTPVFMPHFGWHLGDIEFRGWWGKLTESDWFDNDSSNDNNLIAGMSFAYGFPGIFKGLSVGFNRTMLSKWDDLSTYSLFNMFVPAMTTKAGHDENDQRASVILDYISPVIGLNLYLEWARNDYTSDLAGTIQYPFHTQGWTAGINKSFITKRTHFNIYFEATNLECSADYDRLITWYSTFYGHHIITQGYTNKGQWLGAGIGTGGNCQTFGTDIYFHNNKLSLLVKRTNPDLDYTMYIDSKNKDDNNDAGRNVKTYLDFTLNYTHFFINNLCISSSYTFNMIINPENKAKNDACNYSFNNNFNVLLKYNF